MIDRVTSRLVVRHPAATLVALGALAVCSAALLPGWRLDASADALMLENDPARRVYEQTRREFGSDESLILATSPREPWTRPTIRSLDVLTRQLEAFEDVELPGGGTAPALSRVVSPTNQRLFRSLSPGTPPLLAALKPFTLTSDEVDLDRAREELTASELYAGTLVAPAGDAFAIVATLAPDEAEVAEGRASAAQRDRARARRRAVVAEVRRLAREASEEGLSFRVSGIPAIVVDMLAAARQDVVTFGWLAGAFMVAILLLVLRSVRWVVLPAAAVGLVVAAVLAASVALDKPATVVTANLSSLLVIVGMAHAIHLAVRLRELRVERPELDVASTVRAAVAAIGRPCLYAALTTAVGFASVATSDVRPVIDFGLLMTLGALLSFAVSFTLIPASLALLPHETVRRARSSPGAGALAALARWTIAHPRTVLASTVLVAAIAGLGIARLRVETRFTDYFRESSPISQGLDFIDRELGGTTPLEIVLDGGEAGAFLDEGRYDALAAAHDRLAALPAVGSVQSLAGLRREGEKILRAVAPGTDAGRIPIATLVSTSEGLVGRRELRSLLSDYVTEDFALARCVARVQESSPGLVRRSLVGELEAFVAEDPRLDGVEARVTGVFVLYANMLDSLVRSQVRTGLAVSLALVAMLWVLFRRLSIALIGLAVNVVPVGAVLGIMGWASVPLDMMTIMIASVSLGLAVDATIHYTFRYLAERRSGRAVEDALVASHASIGRAVLYTSATVIGGFWVLALSNFKPSIHFGVMTSLAVAAALLSSLTLLPVLLRRLVR